MVKFKILTMSVLCITFFLVGIYFGSELRASPVDLLDATETSFQSLALEYSLVSNYDNITCEYLDSRQRDLVEQLGIAGNALAKMSSTSPDFSYLKKKYHLQQARSYVQSLKQSHECLAQSPTILFFYDSPQESDLQYKNQSYYALSKEQGLMLDEIVTNSGVSKVSVYAIEYGYVPELSFLESYYNITSAPSIIVNFDTIFVGLTSADAIETALWTS